MPALNFLRPRDNAHPLGTVYRKGSHGFTPEFDSQLNLGRDAEERHLSRAVIGGAVLNETMESLLADTPKSADNLRKFVLSNNIPSLSSRVISVVAHDVVYTYLTRERVLPIAYMIRNSNSFDSTKSHFIADRIVRAKKISYIVSEKFVNELHFDRSALEEAAGNSSNVRKMDGYYIITREWATRKIVAVGQSYFSISKSARNWIKLGLRPGPMEVYMARSKNRFGQLLRRAVRGRKDI